MVTPLRRGRVAAACPQIARSEHSLSTTLLSGSRNKDRLFKRRRGAQKGLDVLWNKACSHP